MQTQIHAMPNSLFNLSNSVHITLQGKGGVGKSVAASFLAQYLKNRGEAVTCFDTDPVNQTLMNYKSLGAHQILLMNGSNIDEGKFDNLMEKLCSDTGAFVVDNGTASFIPLSNYIIENSAFEILKDSGKEVFLHCIVTGGQALNDTLTGLKALASQANDSNIVVWLNEYFGPVTSDGKSFQDMAVYQAFKHRIVGVVRIVQRTADTFGRDIESMLSRKLTFQEILEDQSTPIMVKQRAKMVQRDIFTQLDTVFSD